VRYDAVESLPDVPSTIASTGFSPHRYIPGVQEGFGKELWVYSNAPTLKIYTSVISVGSNGNVMLTKRVTPSTYQPFLPPQRTVTGPFLISVIQGLSGLGISVAEHPAGTVITDIVDSGPVGKNGNVRCG